MRKILFDKESSCIAPLRKMIEMQNHRTLVAWALDCARRYVAIFESRCPGDRRPQLALEASAAWARGEIKMPLAKKAILAAHKAAAEAGDPVAEAAARAAGQAAATVHVPTHALGLVLYGLTAIARQGEAKDCGTWVDTEVQWLHDRLRFWTVQIEKENGPWANFLLRDDHSSIKTSGIDSER